ncbi:MAG: PEP/pyruvate-binding domain-containing protein [Acidimicrobiales bacterium]
MKGVVPLAKARETAVFGSKAVGLGDAEREGLPIPPGVALSGLIVEAVAAGEQGAIDKVTKSVRLLAAPLAVRSSAADEDGMAASFAGQHLTLLNVPSVSEVAEALREIWWSANSDSAITYRQRVGLFTRPSVGVVVQTLLNPEVAGVMFTENPVTGADERVIEASWGLGEAVVAGLVIPDHYRIERSGQVLERKPGRKTVAIRTVAGGGTVEEQLPAAMVECLCLSDGQLEELSQLASRCEQVYGAARDLEWAFAGGKLYLLQCRAITTASSPKRDSDSELSSRGPVEVLQGVPLFAELDGKELAQVARLFKQRRFVEGETVVMEGSGGAAFFFIDSGEAAVSVKGEQRGTLRQGDYFGEIALIDEGPRAATITALSELVCYGLTFWEFRPLVQQNGAIGWKLLQSLARKLREAQDL